MTWRQALRASCGVVLCLLAVKCGSAGRAQLPVNQRPFVFVDATTNQLVESVLVIPKYASSKGVSSGAGHGRGYMTHSSFLASPFVYYSGSSFQLSQPDSSGLLVGSLLFVGTGVTVSGIVVIAAEHRPTWIWDLWERGNEPVLLERLTASEARTQKQRLKPLLEQSRLEGATLAEPELQVFRSANETAIDVRFTDSERRVLRDFFR